MYSLLEPNNTRNPSLLVILLVCSEQIACAASWDVQWLAGGNGDGSITYPGRPEKIGGKTPIPIASHRLKQIRDGLEDLEYMYMLEDLKGRDAAAAIVAKVVNTTYDFAHDAEAFMGARAALAAAVEAAMAP